tara:strand:+ start:447 stop:614 length:168 start_codon:yes stop_codon:yes gene_type:complete
MKFIKNPEKTEIEKFQDLFTLSKKKYYIESVKGVITKVETDDKEIIEYLKSVGIE